MLPVEARAKAQTDFLPDLFHRVLDARRVAVRRRDTHTRREVGGQHPVARSVVYGAIQPRATEAHAMPDDRQSIFRTIGLHGKRFVAGVHTPAQSQPRPRERRPLEHLCDPRAAGIDKRLERCGAVRATECSVKNDASVVGQPDLLAAHRHGRRTVRGSGLRRQWSRDVHPDDAGNDAGREVPAALTWPHTRFLSATARALPALSVARPSPLLFPAGCASHRDRPPSRTVHPCPSAP